MTTLDHPMHGIFIVKDRISALTHFIAFLAALAGMPLLLIKAASYHIDAMPALAIFMGSMILLYGASASYHAFNISPKVNLILKRIDHCNIFLLIAGSYTPVCVMALPHEKGIVLLWIIWTAAVVGVIFKLFFVTCPRWLSSVLYIGMGWACIRDIPLLIQSLHAGFLWLMAGGVFYTVGGIIYALRLNLFKHPQQTGFGNHELFHLLVMAGSLCHFLMIYMYMLS